jgi:hypothetical protein
MLAEMPARPAAMPAMYKRSSSPQLEMECAAAERSSFSKDESEDEDEDDALASSAPNPNALRSLTDMQRFQGNWSWTPALEAVLRIKEAAAKAAAPGYADDVLATACAVAFYKTKLAKDKDTWEMIVEKAEEWLRANGGDAALEKAVQALF